MRVASDETRKFEIRLLASVAERTTILFTGIRGSLVCVKSRSRLTRKSTVS